MNILLITDQFFDANNGYTITARRFARVLRAHGHKVRVVCTGKPNREDIERAYLVEAQPIPIFNELVSSQGMTFAKPNESILREAIAWADVVHFVAPFALSHLGIKIAKELKKPYTAAFHVQPENISSSIHLGNVDIINDGIYKLFRFYIYKDCPHIHCPSAFIADQLKKNGYKGKLHIISNGIDPDFVYRKLPKTEELKGKFVIVMVGRLSVEKRQDLLLDAAKKSKYKEIIQVVLAGKGPRLKHLTEQAKGLHNTAIIGFYRKPDLLDLLAMSDLYVHCSDAEIEAMSCMEAFASGLVPIISNSKKSATPQFALDERSLFEAGNSTDLAEKIDYWIEHPEQRVEMEHKYAESADKYNLDSCVTAAEEMFMQAIAENEEGQK